MDLVSKETVVVVDDSDDIRMRIKDVVNRCAHLELIGEANNGRDAIDLIIAKKPQHLILDIRMPDKSGLQVLGSIQSVIHNINVIVLSNHSDTAYRKRCLKLGAQHFLDKSTEFSQLMKALS